MFFTPPARHRGEAVHPGAEGARSRRTAVGLGPPPGPRAGRRLSRRAVVRSGGEPVARRHRARAHLPRQPGRRLGGGRAVRRRAERAQDPPRRPGLHRRFREGDHGARPGGGEGPPLPRPGPVPGLQGLQRPLLRLERRPLLHRPGPHRAARPNRPGVAPPGRGRPHRVPDRHRPEPERARHGPRRVDALHRGDPRQRGLADALRSGGAGRSRSASSSSSRAGMEARTGWRWTRPAISR